MDVDSNIFFSKFYLRHFIFVHNYTPTPFPTHLTIAEFGDITLYQM